MTDSIEDPFSPPPVAESLEESSAVAEPAKKPVAEKKPAAEKKPRSVGVAINGRPVDVNDFSKINAFPSWPQGNRDDQYIPDEEADYSDLSILNRDINRTRSMLFRVKNSLEQARRYEVEATIKHRQAYNRALVGMSGGTESIRKAIAEIQTEDEYTVLMIAQNMVKEQTSMSYNVSRELETLKTLSDNLRRQMSIQ